MFYSSIHVAANGSNSHSFLWLSNILFCVYIHVYIVCILSQSSIDGHLGSFHVLAVVDNGAMNIGVCVFFFFLMLRTFIWLNWVLVLAHAIVDLCYGMWTLSCDMWDLVPDQGSNPGPSQVLGAQNLSPWTPERPLECIYHLELEFLYFLDIYPGVGYWWYRFSFF